MTRLKNKFSIESVILLLKEAKWLTLSLAVLLLFLTLFVCAVKADNPKDFIEVANAIKEIPTPLIQAVK